MPWKCLAIVSLTPPCSKCAFTDFCSVCCTPETTPSRNYSRERSIGHHGSCAYIQMGNCRLRCVHLKAGTTAHDTCMVSIACMRNADAASVALRLSSPSWASPLRLDTKKFSLSRFTVALMHKTRTGGHPPGDSEVTEPATTVPRSSATPRF